MVVTRRFSGGDVVARLVVVVKGKTMALFTVVGREGAELEVEQGGGGGFEG